MSEQEEENGVETTTTHGRPNAFWARVREEQIEARDGDQFTGAFRGVKPVPHGGSASVHPEDTLGSEDLCWCGQPAGHEWPGKQAGAHHPQPGDTMSGTTTGLDRRDLRAYDKTLQDFVLHCTNTLGVRYRANQNSILLFPPDGSTPMSVYARNSQRQLRQLEKWFTEHIAPSFTDGEVATEDDLRKLVEAKNDPVEHPIEEPKPAKKAAAKKAAAPAYTEEPAKPEEYLPPQPEVVLSNTEWVPYIKGDGTEDPIIVTNGTQWRCLEHAGTDQEYIETPKGIGGHKRMWHTDTSDMRTPEAREKALKTKRERIMRESSVVQAIDLLIEASGYNPTPPVIDDERIKELETELAAAVRRAEEAEAKLSLIREATGL